MSSTTQSQTILITYATRYGSTAEVATAIAETLRTHGLDVDVQPVTMVKTLESYQAVIFGAPLYIGSWPKEAHAFLMRHQATLQQRPLAIFTLGPINQLEGKLGEEEQSEEEGEGGAEEKEWEDVRNQLQKQMAKVAWLQPVALALFGGKLDPAALRFPENLLTKIPGSPLYKRPASDARDWNAIHTWAESLITEMQLTTPAGEKVAA